MPEDIELNFQGPRLLGRSCGLLGVGLLLVVFLGRDHLVLRLNNNSVFIPNLDRFEAI